MRLVEDARLLLAQERTLVVLPPEIIGPQRDIPNHNSCPLIAAAPHDTATAHETIGYKQSAQRLAEQGGAAERRTGCGVPDRQRQHEIGGYRREYPPTRAFPCVRPFRSGTPAGASARRGTLRHGHAVIRLHRVIPMCLLLLRARA